MAKEDGGGGGRGGASQLHFFSQASSNKSAKISTNESKRGTIRHTDRGREGGRKWGWKGAEPSALGIDPLVVYVNVQSTQQLMINYASDSWQPIDSHSTAFKHRGLMTPVTPPTAGPT